MTFTKLSILLLVTIFLNACETPPVQKKLEQKENLVLPQNKKARTLILGDREYQESEPGQLISWKCRDYIDEGETLVEFGQIPAPDDYKTTQEYVEIDDSEKEFFDQAVKMMGFVLYEGSNKGELALYNRRGLDHRWDWGPDGKYSFIIKPDGTGLYYDFNTATNGKKDKADDIYKCRK